MIYILLSLIFIISIILAIEDYKKLEVPIWLLYSYSIALSILFWKLKFPLFCIPIALIILLYIKFKNINAADIYMICILFYTIIMLKLYAFNILMIIPLLIIVIFIFNKEKIPFISIGTILNLIYIIWLLNSLNYI